MADHPNKTTHQILLDALVAFVTEHPNPKVQRFRQTMLNWGEAWTDVPLSIYQYQIRLNRRTV
jgi:hypothetical protein